MKNQHAHAESLVGAYVRFAHLPADMHPTPIRVIEAVNGMVRIAGWTGYFAPHLFVVVKAPPQSVGRKTKPKEAA